MGWFSSSSKSSSNASDGDVSTRQERAKCWEARDQYFTCLDKAGVVKPGEEGNACAKESKNYGGECAKSWIEYFNQRRVIGEAQKDRLASAAVQNQNARR